MILPYCAVVTSGTRPYLWVTDASLEPQALVGGSRIATIEVHDEHSWASLFAVVFDVPHVPEKIPIIYKSIVEMINTELLVP